MERQSHKQVHCHEECNEDDLNKGCLGLQCALLSHIPIILSQFSILIQPNWTRPYFLTMFRVVFIFLPGLYSSAPHLIFAF